MQCCPLQSIGSTNHKFPVCVQHGMFKGSTSTAQEVSNLLKPHLLPRLLFQRGGGGGGEGGGSAFSFDNWGPKGWSNINAWQNRESTYTAKYIQLPW